MQRLAFVQLQPNLSFVDDCVVDRVGFVHPGISLFEVIGQSSQTNQGFFLCGLAVEGRVREDRGGRKRHKVQAGAARSRNDGIGIAIEPLRFAEIRDRWIDPDERVFIARNSLELVGRYVLVDLNDGFPAYIFRNDTAVNTRFLTAR